MLRSSENMAELAAALAKAQTELVNPEKSLTATIAGEWRGEVRSFRYAPLSSGLDIVRTTLGQHAIAVLQSTAIDPTTRLVVLTTMLAHSSGQWVSSEWPVCRSDQPLPQHRMGAALTYARRYSLFSLVGIAGEDDLDAPDLLETQPERASTVIDSNTASGMTVSPQQSVSDPSHPKQSPKPATLGSTDSAAAREELLQEVASLASVPKAVEWAKHGIKQKNALGAEDAAIIEKAFASKLQALEVADNEVSNGTPAASDLAPVKIDKSVLTIATPKRIRDKTHLRFVALQPCLVCGRQPSDPHHLRFAQPRALGLKVSDEFTVPLCRGHHRQLHQAGNETTWWEGLNIDSLEIAKGLWEQSHSRFGSKVTQEI